MDSIGIFEPSWHPELLPPLIRMSLENDWQVTVITTQKGWSIVEESPRLNDLSSVTPIIQYKDEPQQQLVERAEKESRDLDVLWTVTTWGHNETRSALFGFTPVCPAIAFVHEGGRYRSTSQVLQRLGITVLRYASYSPSFVQEQLWSHVAPRLAAHHYLDPYDRTVALYPTITEHLRPSFNKPIDWFLPEFYSPAPDRTAASQLRIAVPGSISSKRRDYTLVFDLLESLPRSNVSLDLVGSINPDETDIRNQIERLQRDGYDIKYSDSWVDTTEFENRLSKADLLFNPLHLKYGLYERKGKTQTTGVIGDAVRMGKPLLMPEGFPVTSEFEGLIYTYNNIHDALGFVKNGLYEQKDRIIKTARDTAKSFCLSQQSERMADLCNMCVEM